MAAIALGLMRPDGREPALNASTRSPPWIWANASAIWLRFEFSTQTKITRFGIMRLAVPDGSTPVRRTRPRRAPHRAEPNLTAASNAQSGPTWGVAPTLPYAARSHHGRRAP